MKLFFYHANSTMLFILISQKEVEDSMVETNMELVTKGLVRGKIL